MDPGDRDGGDRRAARRDGDAMEPLVDYFRRVGGEHDDWDDYRETMQREDRVLVRVGLTAAGPDREG